MRNKTLSFINIFGLAVSMSVCMLLILIVEDQLAFDNFHKNRDRIYRIITERTQQKEYVWSTATAAYPLAEQVKSFEGVESTAVINKQFSGIARWEEVEIPFEGLYTNNDFFDVFSFPLAKGNPKKALTLSNSIVLSKELATKIFGDIDPLNKSINIENTGNFIVTGVLADLPGKTHMQFEALGSVNYLPILEKEGKLITSLDSWDDIYDNYIYFLVKEEANVDNLKPLLKKASLDNYDDEGEFQYDFLIQRLNDIKLGPLLSNTLGVGLPGFIIYILLAMALIVLVSACFNYANLTTARAINRAKEIGVRKVVGAGKSHIIGQFITEAILIAFISFIFADFLLQYLHPQLNNMFATLGAPIKFDETPHLYLIFSGFVLLTGIMAGIVPSLFFAATDPLVALKSTHNVSQLGNKIGFKKFNIKKVLVVFQFAFSIFFVITVITLYQQMQMVMTTDHGFNTEAILNIKLQGMDYETIYNEYDQLAGVRTIAGATYMPALGTNNGVEVQVEGNEESRYLSYLGVDNHFIKSMGLTIVAGHGFQEVMPKIERSIIINEKAVKKFGWKDPYQAIGKLITIDNQPLEVTGVIKDFHYERMDEEIGAMALRYLPHEIGSMIVTINGDRYKEVISQMESIWKSHTHRPFKSTFYADDLRLSYGYLVALIKVLGYITALVVSISCLGLLGMVIFHVQNKTKEIGIRKTLGAEAKDILITVGKGFFILIIISYLIGGPLAYFVNELWLSSYAYRIDFGLPTILLGFIVVLAIVSITMGSQLYRAIHINPVESLRSE